MTARKTYYYFFPMLLAVLMFSTNFLSTNLFRDTVINFAVWFILSIFAFSCGWIITNTLDWKFGGKIVFTVIVVTSFITVIFIMIFHNYFNFNGILTENLILYSLRNVYIGLMGVFGMSVSKLIDLQKELEGFRAAKSKEEDIISSAENRAEIILSKAKLEAEKITFDAEKKLKKIIDTNTDFEKKLNEFIQIEKELINNYNKENR